MMYFAFALVALLCWSGSDLFSKKGTDEKDSNSHWKVTFAVGLIMGIHFFITLIGGAIIDSVGYGKLFALSVAIGVVFMGLLFISSLMVKNAQKQSINLDK